MRLNEKVMQLVDSMIKLYNTEGGETGSYGHVVFDDSNFDFAEACLRDMDGNPYNVHQELFDNCKEALLVASKMDEHDIEQAYNFFWMICQGQWNKEIVNKYYGISL